MRSGRFRADLYMRLNPATRLRVPPLRERRGDLPELVRFAFLEALRSEPLGPLVREYLARFPTPDDFTEAENSVVFGRPRAAAARRDAFSVFVSREGLARLSLHDWPGNHRELKLLAANALVFCLTQHLDAAPAPAGTPRAPAVLDVSDPLDRAPARRGDAAARGRRRPRPPRERSDGKRRIEIELGAGGELRPRVRRRRAPVPARAVRGLRAAIWSGWRASCSARAAPRARSTCASTSSASSCAICGGRGDRPPARRPLLAARARGGRRAASPTDRRRRAGRGDRPPRADRRPPASEPASRARGKAARASTPRR